MIINITHRQDKISPAVRDKIEHWLNVQESRYHILTSAQITLSKTDQEDEVEAVIHAAGKELVAKAKANNLYAALDAAGAKIERQLKKIHGKMSVKKGAAKKHNVFADSAPVAAEMAFDAEVEVDDGQWDEYDQAV